MKKINHALKIVSISTLMIMGLTACGNKESSNQVEQNPASVAEAQAVPMSAQPADQNAPIAINDSNANVDLGGDNAQTAQTVASETEEITNPTDTVADNSAMETISENDEVIDSEPADPNAPKANESNQPVNQKLE